MKYMIILTLTIVKPPCTTLLQAWTSSFHWSSRTSASWSQPRHNKYEQTCQHKALTHLQPLPWEAASVEVHEDVPQALHIVPPALLNAEVGVDGGISKEQEYSGVTSNIFSNDWMRFRWNTLYSRKQQLEWLCPYLGGWLKLIYIISRVVWVRGGAGLIGPDWADVEWGSLLI